jgi:hypothetical protein
MCIPIRDLDPRARRIRAIANIALVIGLLLWTFRSNITVNRDLLEGVSGFLLGLSITINLIGPGRARRCREKAI